MVVVVLLVLSSTLLIPLSCLSLPLQFRFLLETTQHNPSQTPKMQLTTLLGAVALLATSAIASPLVTRAPAHNPATADVTDFHAVRNGTHILYYPPPPNPTPLPLQHPTNTIPHKLHRNNPTPRRHSPRQVHARHPRLQGPGTELHVGQLRPGAVL